METLVALFVIVVGLMGGISAILKILTLSSFSSSKLVAAYLAQEGIEIVRNIRDTNWLEDRTTSNPWDEGLNSCSSGCIADYSYSALIDPSLPVFADQLLNIDGNGLYGYGSGTQTNFKRKITIQKPSSDLMNVIVQVTWSEKGKSYSFSAQENLYNWR